MYNWHDTWEVLWNFSRYWISIIKRLNIWTYPNKFNSDPYYYFSQILRCEWINEQHNKNIAFNDPASKIHGFLLSLAPFSLSLFFLLYPKWNHEGRTIKLTSFCPQIIWIDRSGWVPNLYFFSFFPPPFFLSLKSNNLSCYF